MVDATGTTVDNEAELMAASVRLSWPLARGYLAVSVQDFMATDTQRKGRALRIEQQAGSGDMRGHLPSLSPCCCSESWSQLSPWPRELALFLPDRNVAAALCGERRPVPFGPTVSQCHPGHLGHEV